MTAAFRMLIYKRKRLSRATEKSVVAAQRDFPGTVLEQCYPKDWI